MRLIFRSNESSSVRPEIRTHIENILARFKQPRPKSAPPMLHPAKVITSPRETVEVQPFLVLCPSDIKTLVCAFYPEKRPPSFVDSALGTQGVRSSASSLSRVSGVTLPVGSTRSSLVFDGSSFLSHSISSIGSNGTSREPLLNNTEYHDENDHSKISNQDAHAFELDPRSSDGYGNIVRSALSEMVDALGADSMSGQCHPCAERWAVLYVSNDGKDLTLRLKRDGDDDDEDDSPESDSDDEDGDSMRGLGRDYRRIKEAVVRLVQDYEIPKELAPDSESKEFSNRTSAIKKDNISPASRAALQQEKKSKNPYHKQSQLSSLLEKQRSQLPTRHRIKDGDLKSTSPAAQESVLITMIEAAMSQCIARSDFISAHLYHETLQRLRRLPYPSLTCNGYRPLLNHISRGFRDSISKSSVAIEEFEAWFVWLKTSQDRHDASIESLMLEISDLRDKMWYITAVSTSIAYTDSKRAVAALREMGMSAKRGNKTIYSSRQPRSINPNINFSKDEADAFDAMVAPIEQGGWNKLADEQVETTVNWLKQCGVENFCQGEERIHRFCMEVDKCAHRLVGESLIAGPVLWSSVLYSRDQRILSSGQQKGDLLLTTMSTLVASKEDGVENDDDRPATRSLDFVGRTHSNDLRHMSSSNRSQASLESGKFGSSREIMDSQDSFTGLSSSTNGLRTFWSPFQIDALSTTNTSAAYLRFGSSRTDNTTLRGAEPVNIGMKRFLLDLKQNLIGLLISDWGTLVWSGGSETDEWFSSDLGEECLLRKDEQQRRRDEASRQYQRQQLLRQSQQKLSSQPVIAPPVETDSSLEAIKRPQLALSASNDRPTSRLPPPNPLLALGKSERSIAAPPVATLQNAAPDFRLADEKLPQQSASNTPAYSAAKKAGLLEFPFNQAYKRLLHKFSVHPNPFTKLHALYELQLLVIASLTTRSRRGFGPRRDIISTAPLSPTLGAMEELSERSPSVQMPTAKNVGDSIANCNERRSFVIASNPGNASPVLGVYASDRESYGGSSPSNDPPSTDKIVEILQDLFRDANIRPRTLFRDLQYVASFVPAKILDKTDRGKAFWDTGLAALGLKQDICREMVELADQIVAYHNTERNRGSHTASSSIDSAAQTSMHTDSSANGVSSIGSSSWSNMSNNDVSRYSMADAARMWLITAREGDPTASRELATFYLTSPNLLPRAIQPLSKPREIFKPEFINQKNNDDPMKNDPATMCVAYHWMEISAQGGDELARRYLRSQEVMLPKEKATGRRLFPGGSSATTAARGPAAAVTSVVTVSSNPTTSSASAAIPAYHHDNSNSKASPHPSNPSTVQTGTSDSTESTWY
jgi:hypothetical protein